MSFSGEARDMYQLVNSLLAPEFNVMKFKYDNPDPSIPGILDCYTNPNYSNNDAEQLVFDILTIGSQTRMNYTDTQRSTFGSHSSVRYFWNVSEASDPDPNCWVNMNEDDMLRRSEACKASNRGDSWLQKHLKTNFANKVWLKTKQPGWVCAQSRPPYSLSTLLKRYVEQNITLPDYLLMTDDDTWLNMDSLNEHYNDGVFASDVPAVWAGCKVRAPVRMINWTFPFGGWGTFFSKGSIERMIHPIFCNKYEKAVSNNNVINGSRGNDLLQFEAEVCESLRENLINEAYLFSDGMSVAELMGIHASVEPFCLHSDWATGFWVNIYHVSKHDDREPFYADVKQERLHTFKGSESYSGRKVEGNCRFDSPTTCNIYSDVCHYQAPEDMIGLHGKLIKWAF